MYREEDVRERTLEYFKGDKLATQVWVSKYALKDKSGNFHELTPEDMHHRLAKEFARIENKYENPMSEQEIFELLKDFRYIVPQGSPMFGIGNDFSLSSLSNCYVVGNNKEADSYGSIMRTDEEIAQIYKRRGGCGLSLDHYRPTGAVANGDTLKDDAGATLYMERFSHTTKEVAQSGRRGALMEAMSIKHPDIEKFIDKKTDTSKVTGANVSVKLVDEFMEAVNDNSDFLQTFPIDSDLSNETFGEFPYNELQKTLSGKYINKVKVQKLWNKIIHNAWRSAEPGLLFWDKILKESPAGCYGEEWKELSTNPCSELPLCEYDSCRLLAINLYSYVKQPFTRQAQFDFELFKDHVNKAQRLMDDVVDLEIEKLDKIISKIESDPEPEDIKKVELELWQKIRQKATEGRRTGLGITAEGDMLAALNLTYGTELATDFSIDVHKTMAVESYKASIEMAKERGCFPIWDYKKEWNNPFIQRIVKQISKDSKWTDGVNTGSELQPKKDIFESYFEYGRRNIANLTIAPTGSLSILTQTTSGIEPAFQVYYKRRRKVNEKEKATFIDETGDMWEEYNVFHHKFIEWYKQSRYDRMLEYKSYNECVDYLSNHSEEALKSIIEISPYHKATSSDVDYIEKVKMQGEVQKWVDHSISVTVNMPENVSEKTVSDVYMKAWEVGCKGVTVYREGSRSGVLVSSSKEEKKESDTIIYNEANKRPETLICDIYNISRNKTPHTIVVGKLNNRPYEIFVLEQLPNIDFPNKIREGKVIKTKSKTYKLEGSLSDKVYVIDNIIEYMTKDEQKDTRKFSLMLRHGIKPKFIIEQINEFATITSFDKVIAKVLSNYLEGEKIKGEDTCPSCGSENIRNESGCLTCQDCGWSRCG